MRLVVREGFSEEVAFELKNWKEPAMERPGRRLSQEDRRALTKVLGQWAEWWMLRLERCFRSSFEKGKKVDVRRDGSVYCQGLTLALLLSSHGCTVVKHHLANAAKGGAS